MTRCRCCRCSMASTPPPAMDAAWAVATSGTALPPFTENTLRPKHQHNHYHEVGGDVHERTRHVTADNVLEDAERDATHDGARQRTKATETHGSECADQHRAAHIGID